MPRCKPPIQQKLSLAEKFERHVIRRDGCWGWKGSKHKCGYGWIRDGSKTLTAHVVSWWIHCGTVPSWAEVLHECDNGECTNPDHLFIGTHADNMADMKAKGRANGGIFKLTDEQVRQIRLLRKMGQSAINIGKKYGVSRGHVRNICTLETRV